MMRRRKNSNYSNNSRSRKRMSRKRASQAGSKRKQSSRKTTMSDLATKVLDSYKSDDRYNIMAIYKGTKAVNKGINLFFPDTYQNQDTKNEGIKWIRRWTPEEQDQAAFLVISRKLRRSTYIYFKFIIGDSVLGEVEENYDKGISRFESI